MRWVRRWIAVALVAAVMIGGWGLVQQNEAPVRVSYLWGAIELPLWQALLCFFAAGFALAGSGWLWLGVRARLVERHYRHAVGGLEAEIHQLRNLPLVPEREGGR